MCFAVSFALSVAGLLSARDLEARQGIDQRASIDGMILIGMAATALPSSQMAEVMCPWLKSDTRKMQHFYQFDEIA